MELASFVLIAYFATSSVVGLPTPGDSGDFDHEFAESTVNNFHSLPLEDNVSDSLFDLASLPHEAHVPFNSYSAPVVPAGPAHVAVPAVVPAVVPAAVPLPGVAVNTQVLIPHVEVFRFLETFIQFKNELLARLQILINENWDLVRAILNIIISKVQKLGGFTLVGISILRQVFEFALNIFGSWSVNLPSISVGASTGPIVHPHSTYGAPDVLTTATNFFSQFRS